MVRTVLRLGVVLLAALGAVIGAGGTATAAPELTVSVAAARLLPGGMQVELTGRYVCGPLARGANGVVDLTLTQEIGPTSGTGYGYLFVTVCDGSAQGWSAIVDGVGGRFIRGRAEVVGSGYACGDDGCVFGRFGPTLVRIR